MIEIRIDKVLFAQKKKKKKKAFEKFFVHDQEIKHDSFIAALLIHEARIITQWQADTIDHTIDKIII